MCTLRLLINVNHLTSILSENGRTHAYRQYHVRVRKPRFKQLLFLFADSTKRRCRSAGAADQQAGLD